MSQPIIQFITRNDVINQLALQPDPNNTGNYILWEDSIPGSTIDTFVNEANIQVTAIIGNIPTNDPRYPLAQMLAAKFGALRLVEMMAVRWSTIGLRLGLGSVSVDRLQALREAAEKLAQRLRQDIEMLVIEITRVVVQETQLVRDINAITRGPSPL